MTTEMPAVTSVVGRPERADLSTYREVAEALHRPDRMAELGALLGSEELVERFLSVALHAIATDSELLTNCTPLSIIQAVKDSAALGLEPTGLTGEGVILRYGKQAKFMPMWRGYLKRIRNSREVTAIDCQLVFATDHLHIELGTRPSIAHTPTPLGQPRGEYVGVYAWARLASDPETPIIEPMTVADIEDIRRRSKAAQAGPWVTDWGEMARKTAIRRLAKRLPAEAVDQLLAADAHVDAEPEPEPVATTRTAVLAALPESIRPEQPSPPESNAELDGPSERVEETAEPVAEPEAPTTVDPNATLEAYAKMARGE